MMLTWSASFLVEI